MTTAGLFLITLSAGLAFGFGYCVARLAGVKDSAGFIVASLTAAAGQIVLVAQLLSLFGAWKPLTVILLQLALLAPAAFYARRATGAAEIWSTTRSLVDQALALRPRDLLRHPATSMLAVFVTSLIAVELVLALAVAPNNWDSMTYHLTRVVYWIQESSIAQFPGATERQAAFPINAEVLQGWTMLMAGGDRFAQMIQWTAQLGLLAFVFAAAKDLGHTRRAAFYAASAMVAMPVFVTQATSTQNDLVLAFFMAAAALFLFRAIAGDRISALLAGAAFGLAVGTKSTALIFSAAIVIAGAIYAGRQWRALLAPAVCAVVGVILLGSFNYAQNITDRGSLTAAPGNDVFRVQSVKEVPMNSVYVVWNSTMAFPGTSFGVLEPIAAETVRGTFGRVAARLTKIPKPELAVRHDLHEDTVGMGLPALLLILPALLLTVVRRHPFGDEPQRRRLAYALASICALAVLCLVLRSNEWIGRFATTPATLAIPLVAALAYREGMRAFVLVVVVLSMASITLDARMKPLLGFSAPSVLSLDRIEQQAIYARPENARIRAVETDVPSDGRIGFLGAENSWEYPYAGPNLDRTLVKVTPDEVTPELFEQLDLDALMLADSSLPTPAYLEEIYVDPTHRLLIDPKRTSR